MVQKLKRVVSFLVIFICTCQLLVVAQSKPPYIDARAAIALDSKSKIVLYDKNAYVPIPMASTTKIMTCLVALEYGNLHGKIKISSKAASIRGSQVGYAAGEEIALEELLYGLMMKSGNDAAIAIAEGIGGSVEGFCKIMNDYALLLGLKNTNFESPHGLDSRNHYTSAYDLAMLTSIAMENPKFKAIASCKKISGTDIKFTREFYNINKILSMIPNANGVKTGYTGQAGKCLVSSVEKDGRNIIIVTLNCYGRWKETQKIYEYVSKNYDFKDVVEEGKSFGEVEVKNSIEKCELVCNEKLNIPIEKDQEYSVKVIKPEALYAPLVEGEEVGHIEIWSKEKCIYSKALINKVNVKKYNKLRVYLNNLNKE